MSAAVQQQEPQQYRGRFKKGFDPRRHRFTTAECQEGFWRAIESIVSRYPDAVMPDGRHMVVNFMKSRKREVIH